MQKRPSRRPWLIPGMVAAILFVGAVASNLIASDLETTLKPYRVWVWSFFAIALIVTVVTAIVAARRGTHSAGSNAPGSTDPAQTTRIVNANAKRSAAFGGNVNDSTIVTGDKNVIGKVDGDTVARDKIVHIHQAQARTQAH